MKKTIYNILFAIYIVIAGFVTICLLSYNEFKVTEFGNYSLVIINDDALEPEYTEGALVIVKKSNNVKMEDKVFFYNTFERDIEVKLATVKAVEPVTSSENTYTLEGGHRISSEYVLGPAAKATVVPVLGTILAILASKWGFLFIIVLPALIAFIYQITVVFAQIKEGKQEIKEEAKKEKEETNEEKNEEK